MEENKAKYSAMNIASLVLGIISILTALFWYLAIPTGILAIVFGVKAIKQTGSKLGKAGLITGIIGLGLFFFFYFSMILLLLLTMI